MRYFLTYVDNNYVKICDIEDVKKKMYVEKTYTLNELIAIITTNKIRVFGAKSRPLKYRNGVIENLGVCMGGIMFSEHIFTDCRFKLISVRPYVVVTDSGKEFECYREDLIFLQNNVNGAHKWVIGCFASYIEDNVKSPKYGFCPIVDNPLSGKLAVMYGICVYFDAEGYISYIQLPSSGLDNYVRLNLGKICNGVRYDFVDRGYNGLDIEFILDDNIAKSMIVLNGKGIYLSAIEYFMHTRFIFNINNVSDEYAKLFYRLRDDALAIALIDDRGRSFIKS